MKSCLIVCVCVSGEVKTLRRLNSDLPALLDEWATSLFHELDYVREAQNGVRFKRLYGELEVMRAAVVVCCAEVCRPYQMLLNASTPKESVASGSDPILMMNASFINPAFCFANMPLACCVDGIALATTVEAIPFPSC